ncbi:ABC transporter substrate-binding protein [Thorsellia kenyensis]|uniref:ABC transporter substrate-binding protein n=1 Tax=Thorsellia kenyensis TaxID=1549888 RepID=A0ABV6CD64_9GAMM
MTKPFKLNKSKLLMSMVLSSFIGVSSHAANVPENVKLAKVQELVRGNGGDEIQGLDPHKVEGVPEHQVINNLIETLVITDPNGNLIPGNATHWETTDNMTWTFHLRPEAKWSNGDPVTAHDYVFAWRRIVTPETASPYASYLEYAHILNAAEIIAGNAKPDTLGIKAIDDLTLQVTLSTPLSYLPAMLPHYALAPLHQKTIEQHGDAWTKPGNFVGNAAYNLSEWVTNEKIVLTRNPLYWDNDKTVIEKVTFIPAQPNSEIQRYRAGEIDMTYGGGIPIELFAKLKKELPDELKIGPLLCSYYLEINNQDEVMKNPLVREALKLGTDQKIITDKVLAKGQIPAWGFTPPSINGVDLEPHAWYNETQEERNERAIKLLEQAGYTKDNPLKVQFLYNTSDIHQKVAVALRQIWKKNIGVDVELVNQEWKTFLDSRHNGNHQIARSGWCADYNEATSFLNTMVSNSSNNTAFYKSDEFDALIKSAVNNSNESERNKIYQEAEKLLDKDSAIIPIYYYINDRMIKPHVGGYTNSHPTDSIFVKDLYIIDK